MASALNFDFLDAETETITDAELAAARRKLKAVDNPLGKRFVEMLAQPEFGMHRGVQIRRACRQGARLMLAVVIYLREQGKLPPDLQALVAAKIIDQQPLDAFSEMPFGYSRDQRLIWRPSATDDERADPEEADDAYSPAGCGSGQRLRIELRSGVG